MSESRVELNGREPGIAELAALAQINYGHFTSMRVEQGGIRGFGLHLKRLQDATRELFGCELGDGRIRQCLRRVSAERAASVRVTVFSRYFDRKHPERVVDVDILVTWRSLASQAAGPIRVQSINQPRRHAHIKHVGTFELFHALRQARLAGFDDALFTTSAGEICEGSTWNIGFWDGQTVVWPNGPCLPGVTRQLLDAGLRRAGMQTRSESISLASLDRFQSAFALNSGAIGPMIGSIDRHAFDCNAALLEEFGSIYRQQPVESI